MLVLALDTATTSVVVGVVEIAPTGGSVLADAEAGVRASETVPSLNRHAETLGHLIPYVLGEAGNDVTDLGAVVVGLGPGPFTGLRVGVMTAAAIGDALGVPVYGVCTHDAIAAGYATRAGSGGAAGVGVDGFVVVTDARRRECYWADYDESATRLSGPHVESPALMTARSRLVIGDPAFAALLGVEIVPALPEPGGIAIAARGLVADRAPGPLEPLYLRRPDATPPAPRKLVTPV